MLYCNFSSIFTDRKRKAPENLEQDFQDVRKRFWECSLWQDAGPSKENSTLRHAWAGAACDLRFAVCAGLLCTGPLLPLRSDDPVSVNLLRVPCDFEPVAGHFVSVLAERLTEEIQNLEAYQPPSRACTGRYSPVSVNWTPSSTMHWALIKWRGEARSPLKDESPHRGTGAPDRCLFSQMWAAVIGKGRKETSKETLKAQILRITSLPGTK